MKRFSIDGPKKPVFQTAVVVAQTGCVMAMIAASAGAGAQPPASAPKAAQTAAAKFGPDNPFYAPSPLPFHAPPFDKIKDSDYQPAIDAGMAEQRNEVDAIANNSAAPTFENTLVALEKSGQLLNRVMSVFSGVTSANTNETLQKVQQYEAPRQAALHDAIYLNAQLFARVKAVYDLRESL